MNELLDKPVPIIFAVCQGWQRLDNGTWNFLGIFDRLIVQPYPNGTMPDTVTIPVITSWTGAMGDFAQLLRVHDEDGNLVHEERTPFSLANTSARHNIIAIASMPVRAGVFTMTVGRDDYEVLLRQDFTLQVVAGQPAQ